jgi:hypothetical protein
VGGSDELMQGGLSYSPRVVHFSWTHHYWSKISKLLQSTAFYSEFRTTPGVRKVLFFCNILFFSVKVREKKNITRGEKKLQNQLKKAGGK